MQRSRNEWLYLLSSYPSAMLALGHFVFFSQITLGWWSRDSFGAKLFLALLAALVLATGLGVALWLARALFKATRAETTNLAQRRLIKLVVAGLSAFAAVAFFSALKPAHLIQEGDFANYHLMLPRQFWLKQSWAPVVWSDFEFLHLPNQNAFSYLWLGLPELNKMPQFLMTLFLAFRIWLLTSFLAPERALFSGLLAVLAFFSFRGVGIQVGMGMLDLPFLYALTGLALGFMLFRGDKPKKAALLSLIVGLDLASYLGQKSFSFLYLSALAVASAALLRLLFREKTLRVTRNLRLGWVLLPVALFWIPSAARSFYYTGDPFFPVFTSLTKSFCNSERLSGTSCPQLLDVSQEIMNAVRQYGYGRDPVTLIKSFFIVGTAWDGPTRVNNRFDYPLGVSWFLCWAYLGYVSLRSRENKTRRAAWFACLLASFFYVVWFAGSQQSRWLYPAILVLAVSCSRLLTRKPHFLIVSLLMTLLAISSARTIRSQRETLSCFGFSCLKANLRYWADHTYDCAQGQAHLERPSAQRDRGYLNCPVLDAQRQ